MTIKAKERLSKEVNIQDNRLTKFQNVVYRIASEIPKGKVSTYNLIHKQMLKRSIKSSPRAVGQALRYNPFGFKDNGTIPCHRVISSDLKIHGYYGKMHSERKLELLRDEGITVIDGKVDKDFVFEFPDL